MTGQLISLEISNDEIENAYQKLAETEKIEIDQLAKKLEFAFKAYYPYHQQLGRKGTLEILAKLGIWFLKKGNAMRPAGTYLISPERS